MDEQAAGAPAGLGQTGLGQTGLTRRGALVLGGSVLATTAWGPTVAARAADPGVPTWDEVNGYPLGLRQATVAEIDAYVEAIAAVSPRVTTRVIGRSRGGRAIREVVVTSERNHRRLPALRRRGLALRDEPTTRARATRVGRDLPAFVVVVANVHGNEPSGADALMQVLHDLAAGQDEQTLARLDALVLVMSPVQNPDGRDAFSRPNAIGFDLNRDWFAMTQPETPPRIELFRRYPAVAGLDLHEQFLQGPDAYFFPPNADPVHRESSRTGLWAATTSSRRRSPSASTPRATPTPTTASTTCSRPSTATRCPTRPSGRRASSWRSPSRTSTPRSSTGSTPPPTPRSPP